jgi:hypothetical protein
MRALEPSSANRNILYIRPRSPRRREEPEHALSVKSGRAAACGNGLNVPPGLPAEHARERTASQIQFLVDDGVTCPSGHGPAARKGPSVRNTVGRTGAARRLAERTGELGIVQV